MYSPALVSILAISIVTASAIDKVADRRIVLGAAMSKRIPSTPAPTEWCGDGDWTLCCKGDLPNNPTTEPIPQCKPMKTIEDCPVSPDDNWDSPGNKVYCCDKFTPQEVEAGEGPTLPGIGDGCYPVYHPGWDPIPAPAQDPLGAPSYSNKVSPPSSGTAIQGIVKLGVGAYGLGQKAGAAAADILNNIEGGLGAGDASPVGGQ